MTKFLVKRRFNLIDLVGIGLLVNGLSYQTGANRTQCFVGALVAFVSSCVLESIVDTKKTK